MGFISHRLVAGGGRGEQRSERHAAAAARFGRVSGARVCDGRELELDDDDAVDGRGGTGFDARKSTSYWGLGWGVQFQHGGVLGVGELDGEAAGAGAFGGGSGRY